MRLRTKHRDEVRVVVHEKIGPRKMELFPVFGQSEEPAKNKSC